MKLAIDLSEAQSEALLARAKTLGVSPEELALAAVAEAFGKPFHDEGEITPGKLADLVVIDRDLYKTDPAEIDKARVVLTVMDGRIVYEAK